MTKENVDDLKRQLAEVKDQLAQVKTALTPLSAEASEKATAQWRDQMHQLAERRANHIPQWMHEAVRGGVTTADAQDLMKASHAPQGPSAQGVIPSSQPLAGVHPHGGVAGDGSGWAREIPLGPPPGIAACDRLMDAQDRRDLAERIEQERRLKLMEGK